MFVEIGQNNWKIRVFPNGVRQSKEAEFASETSISFARSATSFRVKREHRLKTEFSCSFICAAYGGNDVSLWLNDVACKQANDVVP